ncbi:PilW family protein [Caldimonas thermodepolymerans]|jgi:Tfp pilus assembly protein PilW|uniref:PilW family protein n=1 Tax=Caldimonas thermodepolymerans TaxID=215580 RepID=UPI00223562B9|nr:PilW family protein [Caldimonas thermodepolymerans]UZG43360.1 PilW family protein [Caldimonas thermodepolymerans]
MNVAHVSNPRRTALRPARRMQGLTLVELMVAIVLGLLILGGVISIFVSNRQAFRTTEELSRMQENARTAFELMARTLREAGGSACGANLPTAQVINSSAQTAWLADWMQGGLRGYGPNQAFPAKAFGSNPAQRVAGTPALVMMHGDGNTAFQIVSHDPAAKSFTVGATGHGFATGDILLACDYLQAAIFQTTAADPADTDIAYDAGGALSPGNCTSNLGLTPANESVQCPSVGGVHTFTTGQLMRLSAEAWYVGNYQREDGRAGRALYRVRLGSQGNVETEELIEGVEDLKLEYLLRNGSSLATSYVEAGSVTDWTQVVSVRVTLTFQGTERTGTDGQALRRQSIHVIGLRNRLS